MALPCSVGITELRLQAAALLRARLAGPRTRASSSVANERACRAHILPSAGRAAALWLHAVALFGAGRAGGARAGVANHRADRADVLPASLCITNLRLQIAALLGSWAARTRTRCGASVAHEWARGAQAPPGTTRIADLRLQAATLLCVWLAGSAQACAASGRTRRARALPDAYGIAFLGLQIVALLRAKYACAAVRNITRSV